MHVQHCASGETESLRGAQHDWASEAGLDAASWARDASCTYLGQGLAQLGRGRRLWGQGRSLDWGQQVQALSLTCCVVFLSFSFLFIKGRG